MSADKRQEPEEGASPQGASTPEDPSWLGDEGPVSSLRRPAAKPPLPSVAGPMTGISSMAMRTALTDLVRTYEERSGQRVALESVGGVDAAERVRAGEPFDLVFLARNAIDKLIASGHVLAGSRVDLVRSGVAVAVRAGAPRPDIGSELALQRTVLAARTIAYSSGPSGVELARLFERWGIAAALRDRIVVPPPGTPVAALIARGEVELGFQQLSELLHVDGVEVLGPLPPAIDVVTIFSGGVGARSDRPVPAHALLEFLASPAAAATKRRHGMEPA
jgi:molybdate transport system substrate-binding protein